MVRITRGGFDSIGHLVRKTWRHIVVLANPIDESENASKRTRRMLIPFLILAVCYLFAALSIGTLNDPPDVGDGHDYDMIAFSLSEGDGFSYHWGAPEWRAPYVAYSLDQRYGPTLTRVGGVETTAYRPPGLPVILAAIYKIFGREFWIWRVLNCLLAAAAYALAAGIAGRLVGKWGVVGCIAIGMIDTQFISLAGRFMTEPATAAALMAAISLMFFSDGGQSSRNVLLKILGAGLALGIMIHLRTSTLPILVAILPAAFICGAAPWRRSLLVNAVTAALVLAVLAPWIIRNNALTNGLFPMGTHWGTNSPEAFADEVFINRGFWTGAARERLLAEMPSDLRDLRRQSPWIEAETISAHYLQSATRAWIVENYQRVPRLIAIKVSSFWTEFAQPFQFVLLLVAISGAAVARFSPLTGALLATLIGQSASIAVSWSVEEGRYMVPFHPLLAMSVVVGIGLFIRNRPSAPRTK